MIWHCFGVSSSGVGSGMGDGVFSNRRQLADTTDVTGGSTGSAGGGGKLSKAGIELESKPNKLFEKWNPFRFVD